MIYTARQRTQREQDLANFGFWMILAGTSCAVLLYYVYIELPPEYHLLLTIAIVALAGVFFRLGIQYEIIRGWGKR